MSRNAVAVQVEPRDNDSLAAGEFYFIHHGDDGENSGIIHACPCGCGGRSALFFRGKGHGNQEWEVTGEWPKVTLSPSIGIRYDGAGNGSSSGYHWHGYLRNGIFEEC
jgi:hypothetical protein